MADGRGVNSACDSLSALDGGQAQQRRSVPQAETLKLVDGRSLGLPDGVGAKYKSVLFYRGHW
jgi:hypothetical protein